MNYDSAEVAAAAKMWQAEAVDAGTPESVAARRTEEAFEGIAEETRARFLRFARVALAEERKRIIRRVYLIAHENRQTQIGDRLVGMIWFPDR